MNPDSRRSKSKKAQNAITIIAWPIFKVGDTLVSYVYTNIMNEMC